MAFELARFGDDNLDVEFLSHLVDRQSAQDSKTYGWLWDYFRNQVMAAPGSPTRPYMQAQEEGLPPRITGPTRHSAGGTDLTRKEIVIENDIAWRVHTMVDFLFGKMPSIRSKAAQPAQAAVIDEVIQSLLQANGGVTLLQEMALLGSVYGFVDLALRFPVLPVTTLPPTAADIVTSTLPALPAANGPVTSPPDGDATGVAENGLQDPRGDRSKRHVQRALAAARMILLETVEAPRVLPILDENDYRHVRYWVQRFIKHPARMETRRRSWLGFLTGKSGSEQSAVEVVEIIGPHWWQRYEDRRLVAEGQNTLGRLPIVHIQNSALPLAYEGLSDVEPLIPLQDELNTRLSDRANRVTYQSFKMYLGKGIDDFLDRPVAPGQMWATQNMHAAIEEFGSDNGSPSEDAHIEQIRSAMDKISGVTPLAAGLIHGNVGNLTSATALRILLSGLLAKTERKRLVYGRGLMQAIELTLEWMNQAGLLRTSPEDRQVEIHWPSPLPADESEQLRNAQIKAQLGVPVERVLTELGYDAASLK